jgi:hypothetical protein
VVLPSALAGFVTRLDKTLAGESFDERGCANPGLAEFLAARQDSSADGCQVQLGAELEHEPLGGIGQARRVRRGYGSAWWVLCHVMKPPDLRAQHCGLGTAAAQSKEFPVAALSTLPRRRGERFAWVSQPGLQPMPDARRRRCRAEQRLDVGAYDRNPEASAGDDHRGRDVASTKPLVVGAAGARWTRACSRRAVARSRRGLAGSRTASVHLRGCGTELRWKGVAGTPHRRPLWRRMLSGQAKLSG